LQQDGWFLRQDIIWHKPNPMPESVKDRCTKAHEYIFLLSKSEKYFFDTEAIKEVGVYPAGTRAAKASARRSGTARVNSRPPEYKIYDGFRNKRSVWSVATKPSKTNHYATFPGELITPCILAGSRPSQIVLDPFAGTGTTAEVTLRLGRRALAIELNPRFGRLIGQRCRDAARSTHA
jgi:site-specific DNA-methyltransferase (adenine-specific)